MKLFALYGDLELATKNFNSGVEAARQQMQGLKGEMDGLQTDADKTSTVLQGAFGHALGDILSGITQAAIETAFTFATEGVELASSVEEIANVVDTTFGTATAAKVNAWAKTTKNAYGIGALSAKDYASTMGATLKGMGVGEDQLYSMSTALVGLAGDMASFRNLGTDEAFRKILSGMTGEMEPLKSLGIIMSETNLASHAMVMGITTDWSKLDSATKTQVRYNYLMQQTADMHGDFADTSESYANQMRVMQENIEQLKLSVGESLLPVMTDLVTWFNTLFGSQEEAGKSTEGITEAYKESYASIEKTTADALALVNALDELSKSADGAASTEMWAKVVKELENTIPGLGDLIGDETGTIEAGTKALQDYVLQWDATMKQLAQKKALASMQQSLYELEAEVASLETEQWWSGIRKSGAQKAMADLGTELFNTMLAGMKNMRASEADIKAMERFGASGAENLLARIAGGGNASMIMSALLEGGDIWKNKSFMEYFAKGGGTEEQLSLWAASYAEHEGTYDQYDVDYNKKISDLTSQVEEMTAKYNAAIDRLAEKEAERQSREETTGSKQIKPAQSQNMTVNLSTTVQVGGQEVASVITPMVTDAVMSAIDWRFQTKAVQ